MTDFTIIAIIANAILRVRAGEPMSLSSQLLLGCRYNTIRRFGVTTRIRRKR